jgi:hypothetical protein
MNHHWDLLRNRSNQPSHPNLSSVPATTDVHHMRLHVKMLNWISAYGNCHKRPGADTDVELHWIAAESYFDPSSWISGLLCEENAWSPFRQYEDVLHVSYYIQSHDVLLLCLRCLISTNQRLNLDYNARCSWANPCLLYHIIYGLD